MSKHNNDNNYNDEHNIHPFFKVIGMLLILIVLVVIFFPFAGHYSIGHDILFKSEKEKLETFAKQQYHELFNKDEIDEDSILIVYVVHDYHKYLDAFAQTGDNVPNNVKNLLTYSKLTWNINHKTPYTTTLGRKITSALDWIYIASPKIRDDVGQVYIKNDSDIYFHDTALKKTLENMTKTTHGDIAVVIVENEMIYGNYIVWKNILIMILVIILPVLLVKYLKRKGNFLSS